MWEGVDTYARDTKVLNGWYSVSYLPETTVSISTLALLKIKSVVSVLSKRTSEVKLSLFERVEVREGVLNEIRR